MRFTWNETKRRSNLKKHGLDFADGPRVLNGPTLTEEDRRPYQGEQRFNTMGLLGVAVVVICHTETEDEIHIISMREAENHETRKFFSYL
jgi:uncharacterized DUF497 family protein